MSNNIPFLFGAGGGVPLPPAQQEVQPASKSMGAPQSVANGQQQGQGQHAQQAAISQNAQLPAVDLSVLKELRPDQLAIIAQLVQAGHFPLPPSAPSVPTLAQTAVEFFHSNTTVQPPEPLVQENGMSVDKEEGEVEEGEVDNTPRERDFLRLPPTGPRKRNRSSSPHGRSPREALSGRVSSQNLRTSPPRPAGGQPSGRRASHYQVGGRGDRYVPSPDRQVGKRVMASPPPSQLSPKRATDGQRRVTKGDAAKDFVREMYRNGYKFEQLAKDLDDPEPLRKMFEQLGLPVSPEPPVSAGMLKCNGASTSHAAKPLTTDTVSQVTLPVEARKPSVSRRPPPLKPAVPASRAEYLAKLKAAVAKQPGATASPPSPGHLGAIAVTAAELVEKSAARPEAPLPPPEPQPKARPTGVPMNAEKTELVRKRLAELKAQNAARLHDASIAGSKPVTSSQPPAPTITQTAVSIPRIPRFGVGSPNVEAEALVQQAPTEAPPMPPQPPAPAPLQTSFLPPTSTTPIRTFSGLPGLGVLPGLSMSGSPFNPRPAVFPGSTFAMPSQAAPASETRALSKPKQAALPTSADSDNAPFIIASQRASPGPLQVESKSSVAPNFDGLTLTAGHGHFGQPRHESADERLVIHVSDGEDDDSDDGMDLDVDPPTLSRATKENHAHDMGPLRDFPSRLSFAKQTGSSVPGTPRATTPGGTALAQREAEIQATRRRIAELEQRRLAKLSGKATPVTVTSGLTDVPSVSAAGDAVNASVSEQAASPTNAAIRDATGLPDTKSVELQVELHGKVGEANKKHDGDQRALHEADFAHQSHMVTTNQLSIDRQATTASVTSIVDTGPTDTAAPPIINLQDQSVQEEDSDMADIYEPELSAVRDQEVTGMIGKMSADLDRFPDLDENGVVEKDEIYPNKDGSRPSDAESSNASSSRSEEYEPEADIASPEASQEVPVAVSDEEAKPPACNTTKHEDPIVETAPVPELQPSAEQQRAASKEIESPRKPYFTTYQSPLSAFKDYIYHPDYLTTVTDGFKSLTFSHNIDPMMAVCRYEGDGGRCNDANCEFQHFRDMPLADHKLLTVMGSARIPAHTPDEEKRWKEGLGAVVKRLRSSNQGRDVAVIAAHIAAFRREFVGDETKVIDLSRNHS